MQTSPFRLSWVAVELAVVLSTSADANIPIISGRTYVSERAKVTVTGSFQINEDIAFNDKASYSDGEMTWLQYGVSGAETPGLLVTASPDEVGIIAGRGKPTVKS